MGDQPIRVMLVDDHEVVRQGIRAMIEAAGGMVVAGEAGGVAESVEVARSVLPDVVVMDVRLTDGTGIEACREIRALRPETHVIMLTSFADDEALFSAVMAGASGYVLKQVTGGELVRSIRTVAAGGSLLVPGVTASVLDHLRRSTHLQEEKLNRLSPLEERILTLVADGKTDRQIGEGLDLDEKTVKSHVSSIRSKLEAARRAEAAAHLAGRSGTPGE